MKRPKKLEASLMSVGQPSINPSPRQILMKHAMFVFHVFKFAKCSFIQRRLCTAVRIVFSFTKQFLLECSTAQRRQCACLHDIHCEERIQLLSL